MFVRNEKSKMKLTRAAVDAEGDGRCGGEDVVHVAESLAYVREVVLQRGPTGGGLGWVGREKKVGRNADSPCEASSPIGGGGGTREEGRRTTRGEGMMMCTRGMKTKGEKETDGTDERCDRRRRYGSFIDSRRPNRGGR